MKASCAFLTIENGSLMVYFVSDLYFLHFEVEENTLVFLYLGKSQFTFTLLSLVRNCGSAETELRLDSTTIASRLACPIFEMVFHKL